MRNPVARQSAESGITHQIRNAAASGEFSKARLLWEDYGRQFRADILRGPVPKSRLAEARELYEWTRMVALCARAHAQAKLNQIAVAGKYRFSEQLPQTTRIARF